MPAKKNDNLDEASGSINLLPEEMRNKEIDALQEKGKSYQVEYRAPKGEKTAKPKEAKLPWFSFWLKRDKTKKPQPLEEKALKVTDDKVKVKLNILKKHKEDKQRLESAKEEAIKKNILNSVFKDSKNLPAHDYSLVNKPLVSSPVVDDMFTPTPTPESSASEARSETIKPVVETVETLEKSNQDLPAVLWEPRNELVAEAVVPKKEEPITPEPQTRSAIEPKEKKSKDDKKNIFHRPETGSLSPDDEGLGVNLIPTSLTVRSWRSIAQSFIVVLVITLIFNGLAFGALVAWEQQIENQTTEVDLEINKVTARIADFETFQSQIAAMEEQINNVVGLLEKHIYWTTFFKLLEKYTLDDVYFEGFSAGINGTLSLRAHGPTFASAARQLKLLQTEAAKEFVTSVSITQVSDTGTEAGKTFTVDLVLNSDLFYYDAIRQEE